MKQKLVLAYSGGLDTSVAIKWLDEQGYDVIACCLNVGEGKDLERIQQKALKVGAVKSVVIDAVDEFVNDFARYSMQAHTLYEGVYPLVSALSRPLISKKLVEVAQAEGAIAVAHGCTGKGNDQVRFEVSIHALDPSLQIIAPVREWKWSREEEIGYAAQHNIPIPIVQEEPFSIDQNIWGRAIECGILEDPWSEPEEDMWRWSVSPEAAPDQPTYIELTYEKGDIVAIDGKPMSPATVLAHLNKVGGENGIGRLDLVENRYVGMKSRGCYETPGGTIMLKAHRAIESLTLDREVAHLKDSLMPKYAEMVYNGYWWSPERKMMQTMIDESQDVVNGKVRLKLYKGNVIVAGRQSDDSLFDEKIATFEDDAGAYNQKDAEGFIKLNALRLRIAANKNRKLG